MPCCRPDDLKTIKWTSRRDFLRKAGAGFGVLGLAGLHQPAALFSKNTASLNPLAPKPGHFPAKAKACISLFMYGGPSGIDLFEPKPMLERMDGKSPPAGLNPFFGSDSIGQLMKSPYRFQRHGKSGMWVSEVFPHLATCVDDIGFLKGCYVESNNHGPALMQMNSGVTRIGHPTVGSWMVYGLGSENQNLPGYVVMYDHRGGPINGSQNWASGFLPSYYQATPLRSSGSPMLNLATDPHMTREEQRRQLDLISKLGDEFRSKHPQESAIQSRIETHELAFRMQMAAPSVLDISQESPETKSLYGIDKEISRYFGIQCLMARRLVEKGVRFIQLYSSGGNQQTSWDAHFGLKENHDLHCPETDQPIAGLIKDLKRRGMLDETLLVWGGEFGRLPTSQKTERGSQGRDHNSEGFSMWMAGGGIQGGTSFGSTDELGWKATEGRTSVNDIHATILHLMGIDHERLTYNHNGRPYRLTDVSGRVINEILA